MIGSSLKPAARTARPATARPAAARPSPLARRRRPSPSSPVAARAGGNVASSDLRQEIEALLSEHRVVLFMKGTRAFPMCGFSNSVVQVLRTLSVNGAELPFHTVNILEREDLRSGMKEYSQWPTFPQVYIDGEFFGGCDIVLGKFSVFVVVFFRPEERSPVVVVFFRRPLPHTTTRSHAHI